MCRAELEICVCKSGRLAGRGHLRENRPRILPGNNRNCAPYSNRTLLASHKSRPALSHVSKKTFQPPIMNIFNICLALLFIDFISSRRVPARKSSRSTRACSWQFQSRKTASWVQKSCSSLRTPPWHCFVPWCQSCNRQSSSRRPS